MHLPFNECPLLSIGMRAERWREDDACFVVVVVRAIVHHPSSFWAICSPWKQQNASPVSTPAASILSSRLAPPPRVFCCSDLYHCRQQGFSELIKGVNPLSNIWFTALITGHSACWSHTLCAQSTVQVVLLYRGSQQVTSLKGVFQISMTPSPNHSSLFSCPLPPIPFG